jgi:hypothetical protein
MALIPIDQVGQMGIVKDINAWQLPLNVWTDGNNIRAEHGAIQKTPGYKEVMATCPVAPYHIVNLEVGSSNYWIIGGTDAIHVHNGSTWTDITRVSGAYNATAAEGWTSTVLGGVLIMANGFDDPQFWALSSGVPSVSTKMADLSNWPASTEAYSVRAFRSFLIALNIKKSSVPYTRLVKWSTEAATQAVPTSWDETSATVDAGEYELADSKGKILDGMPLGDAFMIYKEDSTYSMTYVGTPFIFAFRQLSPTIGALSKNCVAEFSDEQGTKHFIFGNGDMYVNDGRQIKPILPHKMRDYVFGQLNGSEYEKSFVVADYANTEIWACYVTSASDQCDKALVYNWSNSPPTFTERDIPDLGFVGYGTQVDPTSVSSWNAATTTWTSEDKNWNEITTTSFISKEGKTLIMASASDTKLYRNGTGHTEDGTDMTSFIERTGLSMDAQGQPNHAMVKQVTSVWPKMSGSDSVNVYVGSQMSTEDSVTWEGPYTFDPDTQSKVPVRVTGKYIGVKFESTGDQTWRLDGYSLDVQNAGIRGSKMN